MNIFNLFKRLKAEENEDFCLLNHTGMLCVLLFVLHLMSRGLLVGTYTVLCNKNVAFSRLYYQKFHCGIGGVPSSQPRYVISYIIYVRSIIIGTLSKDEDSKSLEPPIITLQSKLQ